MSEPIFDFYCLDCSFNTSVEETAQYHADQARDAEGPRHRLSVWLPAMTHHARTGEALLDMLQRTLYEFEDGTNADPKDRADYSPDERLP
jgi:hypothetical protein